jgi:two-component system, sensor histidine kinase and response regulator
LFSKIISYLVDTSEKGGQADVTRRARTLTIFIWMSIFGVLITNLSDYLQGIPSSKLVSGVVLMLLLSLFYLVKRRLVDTTAYALLFIMCGMLYYDTLLLGAQLGSFIFFICIMVAVPYMANTDKKYQVEILAAIPVFFLVLALLVTTEPIRKLSAEAYWLGLKTNMLTFTVLMFLFMYATVFASRRLNRKLEDSTYQFESLLEQTTYLIWSVNRDLKLEQGNGNFLQFFERGYHRKIEIGDELLARLSSELQHFWTEKYQQAFSGKQLSFVYTVIFEGKERIAEITIHPVKNERGDINTVVCYANDITQKVMVNKALETSQAVLQDTLALAKVGIWSTDVVTNTLEWDARMSEIMGLPAETQYLKSQDYYERIHPQDLQAVTDTIAQFEKSEQELMLEHRIITPAGKVKYILEKAKAERDEFGKLLRVVGYTQDITELRSEKLINSQTTNLLIEIKLATEELLAFENFDDSVAKSISRVAKAIGADYAWVFQHRLFDGGGMGAALLSPNLVGKDLPREVLEAIKAGRTYEEMGVQHWYELLSRGGVKVGDTSKEEVSGFLRLCNLKRYVVLPIFLKDRFWGFIGFDAMDPYRTWTKNDENILQGFCNTLGSVIRMSQYQNSLKQAKELAEQATQTKTNFLSNISHEIRTPMNAIIGLTDLLMPGEKDDERLEYLNAIKFSGDNLLRLINDLLDLSKIEANKMNLDSQPFPIKELLRQFEKVMRYLSKEKQLRLNFSVDKAIPNLLAGDQIRLNQILLNLGSNAVKFTEKGEVSFEIKVESQQLDTYWIELRMKDTGIGIADDKLELIFDSFEQAEKYISRTFGGTGLGLTITNKLVELMGGSITVNSEKGVGTTFLVRLPLGRVAGEGTNESRYSSLVEKDLKGCRILVVEDNKINILLVTRLLKSWKANFEVAENGLEAQELLIAQRFDLVLLDLQMPIMNGFELMERLRTGEAGPQIDLPVMALTADAYEQTRGKALSLGFNDFVTKPIQSDDLYQKIYTLVYD